jgi:hypothetical protein
MVLKVELSEAHQLEKLIKLFFFFEKGKINKELGCFIPPNGADDKTN